MTYVGFVVTQPWVETAQHFLEWIKALFMSGVCVFLANLLVAVWIVGHIAHVMSSERWLPLAGWCCHGRENSGSFFGLCLVYHRSTHGLVMEDHAVAIAIKALWRQVTWQCVCIFSSISANLPQQRICWRFCWLICILEGKNNFDVTSKNGN